MYSRGTCVNVNVAWINERADWVRMDRLVRRRLRSQGTEVDDSEVEME